MKYFAARPRTRSRSIASSSTYKRRRLTSFWRAWKDFFYRGFLGRDIAVNLAPVSVVVGQSRMNLRQRKMLDLGGDLLGSQTQVVPSGNPPNRYARPCDARPAFRISADLSIRVPIRRLWTFCASATLRLRKHQARLRRRSASKTNPAPSSESVAGSGVGVCGVKCKAKMNSFAVLRSMPPSETML